jgi:hypothetical protein
LAIIVPPTQAARTIDDWLKFFYKEELRLSPGTSLRISASGALSYPDQTPEIRSCTLGVIVAVGTPVSATASVVGDITSTTRLWYLDGVSTGITTTTYTPAIEEVGQELSCEITVSSRLGSDTAMTAAQVIEE